MATVAEIEQACEAAETGLATFRADPAQVPALTLARTNLQWLREQYKRDSASLGPYVERLRACSQQLTAAMRQAAQALAEEYIRAGQMIEAWQERRDMLRDALGELVRTDNIPFFQAPSGTLDVKTFRSVRLPAADSPERQELLSLIEQADLWPETCVVNPVRLLKAIDGGRFQPAQAARLAAICPVETSTRLSLRGGRA